MGMVCNHLNNIITAEFVENAEKSNRLIFGCTLENFLLCVLCNLEYGLTKRDASSDVELMSEQ